MLYGPPFTDVYCHGKNHRFDYCSLCCKIDVFASDQFIQVDYCVSTQNKSISYFGTAATSIFTLEPRKAKTLTISSRSLTT